MDHSEFWQLMGHTNNPAERESRLEKSREPQVYNFLKVGDCLFRSQLDCFDPATGRVFDVKTRATAGVRYNISKFKDFVSSKRSIISKYTGPWSSYEREYYDMLRSKFLAFSFQLRIGEMDGAFVAYHNTAEMFGFQFVSRDEIDTRVYGSPEVADWSFDASCKLLQNVTGAITKRFPDAPKMYVITSIAQDHLDFYVDPDPDNVADTKTAHRFRLELRRQVNGKELFTTDQLVAWPGDDVSLWSKLTESEASFSEFLALKDLEGNVKQKKK